jgi:hypothetical protein
MRTPEIRSLFQNALALAAASYFLVGCDELTRFAQERYECGANPNGLVEIDFREFKEGSKAAVTFTDETMIMPIIKSSDERFTLASQGLIVRVDRGSGTIRLTRGTSYRNVECKKSKFRM